MNRFTPIARSSGQPGKPPAKRRYWAFLSYAHGDAAAAAKLHAALERFKVPPQLIGSPHPLGSIPARLRPIFRDRQELAASSNLGREIAEAIERSHYLVVLCSPTAARSRWVDQEVLEFRRHHGSERILAAILDGEPGCGDSGRECFPPSLREDGQEPIAADLRPTGDGWRGGFLKIVAGMLDVGLDDLVQRDQQRRQKRMAWISTASLVGMAATSGLAAFAVEQRDAAREERRQAEGLVEFMLGDLKTKLEPIGKLDALAGVGGKILDYYAKQDASELDDAGLLQRSRALSLTAQVAMLRGDPKSAERLYREALAGTGEAIERNPADPQRLFDHAQNVFWIGELARARGDLDRAERAAREYADLGNRMVALDPTNVKWRLEAVYGAENIAISLYNRRKYAEATARIQAALGPMAAMAATHPDNREYSRELSTVLAWLGDSLSATGRLAQATAVREQQVDHLTAVIGKKRGDVTFDEHLIPANRALGILYSVQGQSRRGLAHLRSAVAHADRLAKVEPENARWAEYGTGARLELANFLILLDRLSEARSENDTACASVAQWRKSTSEANAWAQNQTDCLSNRARLALASGRLVEALSIAEQSLQSARSERHVDAYRTPLRVAYVQRLIGDIYQQAGNGARARQTWEAALSRYTFDAAQRPREMSERLVLLLRLGRRDEAQALRQQLQDMGFRTLS